MKRIFSLLAACLLAAGLAACGSSPASSGEPKDYAAILTAARPAEDNENYVIFRLKDGAYRLVFPGVWENDPVIRSEPFQWGTQITENTTA